MTKPTLYILTGLPYSGKTTLTNELVKRFGFKTASVDDVMDERGLDSDTMVQEDWNAVYSEAYERLKVNLTKGDSVIFDMGHLKFKERETARQIAESVGAKHKLIYINTSPDETRERWARNETTKERGQLSDRGMKVAFSQFQEPTADENPIIYNQQMDLDAWIKESIEI
ncbi:MAG: ATP-binding protein [Patescibacteria group bacterium]